MGAFGRKAQFLPIALMTALASVGCNGLGEGERHPFIAKMNNQALAILAAHASTNEVLVNGVKIHLPLTKTTYFKGKYLSKSTKAMSIRAYDAANSVQVDWAKMEVAEDSLRRSLYGGWNPAHLNILNQAPQKVVRATLWLKTKTVSLLSSKATLSSQMSQIKKPFRASLTGTKVIEVWDDPAAPILVVQGDAKTIAMMGYHPSVGWSSLNADKYRPFMMADGQERLDMSFPNLVRAHGVITDENYGPIVMWDGCVPPDTVTFSDPAANKFLYIPLGTQYTNPFPSSSSPCYSSSHELIGAQSHSSRTLGIVAGRKDSYIQQNNRGIDGFLPSLPSIHIATVGDIDWSQPGAEVTFMQRMQAVAQANPLVQSWSAFFGRAGDEPWCKGTPDTWHIYADWLSIHYPSLNLYSAGNHAATGGGCSGPVWVIPKMKNGIVVGGYFDGNATPANNTMYTDNTVATLDGYSAWRSPYSPHEDIRVPHLSAVGTYVQSVDPWWRYSVTQGPLPPDPPYVRCDKQADQTLFYQYDYTTHTGDWTVTNKGTSFATPQVAGLAAYAMRWSRCLYGNTQKAVQSARALLIASSDRDVSVNPLFGNGNLQPYPLITGQANYDERRWAAGAGAVNAGRLKHLMGFPCIPSPYVFTDWTDPNDPRQVPQTGTHTTGGISGELRRCRFVLTWPPNPSCSEYNCDENGWRGHDLDLVLETNAGQQVGIADSWDNNYEFMDVRCPAATQLRWYVSAWADPTAPAIPFAVVGYDIPQ